MVCDTVNKGLGGHTFSISSYFDFGAGMVGGRDQKKAKPQIVLFYCENKQLVIMSESSWGKKTVFD